MRQMNKIKNKIKTLAILAAMLFIGLSFFGCSKLINEALGSVGIGNSDNGAEDGEDYEENALRLAKDTTYYNDFLGVSYKIPKGWWLYDVNEDNFSTEKGEITDSVSMDAYYDGEDETTTAYFISFGNLQSSTKQNHLGFDLNAETLKGANDISGYMKYYEEYMLRPVNETTYSLEDSDTVTISGKSFELRVYLVDRDEDDYYIITLTTAIKQNYFLNILINYWPENQSARKDIIDSVTKALTIN